LRCLADDLLRQHKSPELVDKPVIIVDRAIAVLSSKRH
jgi:hypothetical protein